MGVWQLAAVIYGGNCEEVFVWYKDLGFQGFRMRAGSGIDVGGSG